MALALDAELEARSPARPAHHPGGRVLHAACGPPRWPRTRSSPACTFPVWTGRCGLAVEELARRHGDFAIAGAVVAVELDDGDRVRRSARSACSAGLDARAGARRPRPRSPVLAARRRRRRRGRAGGGVGPRRRPVRPARLGRLPDAGSARRWWPGPGPARSRRPAVPERSDGRGPGERRGPPGQRSSRG